jgi:hypothetical protein
VPHHYFIWPAGSLAADFDCQEVPGRAAVHENLAGAIRGWFKNHEAGEEYSYRRVCGHIVSWGKWHNPLSLSFCWFYS